MPAEEGGPEIEACPLPIAFASDWRGFRARNGGFSHENRAENGLRPVRLASRDGHLLVEAPHGAPSAFRGVHLRHRRGSSAFRGVPGTVRSRLSGPDYAPNGPCRTDQAPLATQMDVRESEDVPLAARKPLPTYCVAWALNMVDPSTMFRADDIRHTAAVYRPYGEHPPPPYNPPLGTTQRRSGHYGAMDPSP